MSLRTRAIPGRTDQGDRSAPTGRWWVLRVLLTLVAVVYCFQAVLPGQFLSGTYGALQWHQILATTADILMFPALVVAVTVRWPGGGPLWPALATLGLLVLQQVQSLSGADRLVSLHIPLGVAMVVLVLALTARMWRAPDRAGTP